MDIILGMIFTFLLLIYFISSNVFVGIPLLFGLLIFCFIAYRRGFLIKDIFNMAYTGSKKAFVVLQIFFLIGGITSIWMCAGTVPAIVYYGIKFMNPNLFILYAFLISSIVSILLGTSFGTVGTVGIALMVLARSGNINLSIAAGAIISGSFLGDRCSPMSSSANLVANLTNTNLYLNIKNMIKTSIIPFIVTCILYAIISLKTPLNFLGNTIDNDILATFNISVLVLLPSFIIIILSLFKVNVKLSMLISIVISFLISITYQNYSLMEVIKFLVLGFKLDPSNPLSTIIKGGGIISMWKASFVIFVSCALAGIFNGTNMLKTIENILLKAKSKTQVYLYTFVTSILTGAFGCNQAISVVLTTELMSKVYKKRNLNDYNLAIDIENTSILLSALIPWNIAAFVPTTTLNVDAFSFIPYAFYLYLLPIINIFTINYLKINKDDKKISNIL
ncbi:MAG: Na+/H+ antiporter NhaC family protein [Peptostreptococcaceae bacterium]|jgi:NhaC family Na+:H+ antiporter|nr:Na+/H+ antiporter NhaC family protein [Peptostreptococcaceae bacterium]